MLIRPFHFPK